MLITCDTHFEHKAAREALTLIEEVGNRHSRAGCTHSMHEKYALADVQTSRRGLPPPQADPLLLLIIISA